MNDALILLSASADPTNRPLAWATVVISAVLIVAGIAYVAMRREHGNPTDEGLLKALDDVEWYANDIGDKLLAAQPDDRAKIVNDAADRIGQAHANLIEQAPAEDDGDWEQLVIELTNTEAAYDRFAQADIADTGAIAQHRHVLTEKLERFRKDLA